MPLETEAGKEESEAARQGLSQDEIREQLAELRQALVQVRRDRTIRRQRWEVENEHAREWVARIQEKRRELQEATRQLEDLWTQEAGTDAEAAKEAELVKEIQELTAELE